MNSKALFIGPYGENKEEFVKWVQAILEDVIQWRRNFHPNDSLLVSSSEKSNQDYVDTHNQIDEALESILAELKQSLPYHSPRYLGHMLSVLSMPAILGYFTGILYNQNNVVGEVSPITTRLEMEFISNLCEMIGYPAFDLKYEDAPASFGHLTSGGSTAILEGLWMARNLKYYPLSLKLFIDKNKAESCDFYKVIAETVVAFPNKTKSTIAEATYNELFNVSPSEVIQITERIYDSLDEEERKQKFQKVIEDYLVQSKGVLGMHTEIPEKIQIPKLYVCQTSHYSWKKNLDILGFGKDSVIQIKSDLNFKMDIADLKEKILENRENPILAIIAIAGTTEEGAIDPVTDILKLKEEYIEPSLNKSFYFKVDAAWGGYFASMYKNQEKNLPIIDSIKQDILNIKKADSVVIDPHKQGYIPYAVGSVLYKDTRYKDFIFKGAPYLANSRVGIDPLENTYLGGWVLEGSRSGAAAVACAMSTRAVALDSNGYGKFIFQGIKICKDFYNKLLVFNSQNTDFNIVPVYEPQTNVACYVITAPEYFKNGNYINKLNKAVYSAMSVHPKGAIQNYNYFVTKTELAYNKYNHVINQFEDSITINESDFELVFLRSVFMNPNIEGYQVNRWEQNKNKKVPLLDDFLNEIKNIGHDTLPSILLEILKEKNDGKRLKVLWVENKDSFESIKNEIEQNRIEGIPAIGHFLDIDFENYTGKDAEERIAANTKHENYDYILFDLNLFDHHHVEWKSGIELIDKVYENKIKSKAIVYSQFLVEEKVKNAFKRRMKKIHPEVFCHDFQFIAKTEESEKQLHESLAKIVKSIYKLCQ